MSEWQDISTAPTDGTPIIGGRIGHSKGFPCWNFEGQWVEIKTFYNMEPQVWKPVSKPPTFEEWEEILIARAKAANKRPEADHE